jgi:hypothetical protein
MQREEGGFMTSPWTKKQQEFLEEATHRWNIKCGAT